jgi:hypothetical protein
VAFVSDYVFGNQVEVEYMLDIDQNSDNVIGHQHRLVFEQLACSFDFQLVFQVELRIGIDVSN